MTQARTSDPAVRQRERLELALTKATKATTRMIQAFQEQLITTDELRSRMPDLRARESNMRSQLDALDSQLADRDAYLTLADDLQGFLAQLRDNAGLTDVPERQRVLRLLVKNVLIGPDKITIQHRIPVRERTTGHPEQDPNDTEGDMRQSYPLRWGRGDPTLRTSAERGVELPVLQVPGLQHAAHQPEKPFVVEVLGQDRPVRRGADRKGPAHTQGPRRRPTRRHAGFGERPGETDQE